MVMSMGFLKGAARQKIGFRARPLRRAGEARTAPPPDPPRRLCQLGDRAGRAVGGRVRLRGDRCVQGRDNQGGNSIDIQPEI